MSLSRRDLLRVAAAAAAVGCGVREEVASFPDDLGDLEPARAAMVALRAHLSSLDVPPEAVLAFFRARAEVGAKVPSPAGAKKLAKIFLLSTDLFLRAAGDTGPLRFVAYADPYVTPCWNPLARPPG